MKGGKMPDTDIDEIEILGEGSLDEDLKRDCACTAGDDNPY